MGKYEPLSEFLRKQPAGEVRMSFEQIERVIGDRLPPSAVEHRAWWSNNPNNSVMTKAWLDAGFRSEQVDMAGRKLVFRRVAGAPSIAAPAGDLRPAASKRHPLYGWMKGTVTIAPGVDLAEPLETRWGEIPSVNKTVGDPG